jgi:hypothetical protein
VAHQLELLEQAGLDRQDFGGRGVVVKVAQQQHEAADQRGIGIATEATASLVELPDQPDLRDAAPDAMVCGAFRFRKRRTSAGAIDHRGQAFLRIVDHGQFFDHTLLFFNQAHGPNVRAGGAACKHRAGRFHWGMHNPFALSWLWRGLMGNSITFSILFASLVIGFSVSDLVKHGLARLGVHWLYVIIIPVVFFGWLAKREEQLLPDVNQRKFWARGLIAASIVLAILISRLKR